MKLTEKQKNCPYCHEEGIIEGYAKPLIGDIDEYGAGIFIGNGGYYFSYWSDGKESARVVELDSGIPLVNCPMCGRPLSRGKSNEI